jgi:hypothetical protein
MEKTANEAAVKPMSDGLTKFRQTFTRLHLFDCNPFYLISALLLIYSIYRISVGPRFLPTDKLQVIFNFSSLESYSVLLVLTVIFLARRAIWYDATLLTVIENILVVVPFMLLSHASFVENDLAGLGMLQ